MLWSTGRLGDSSPGHDDPRLDARALPIASLTPGPVTDVRLNGLCAGPRGVPAVPPEMQHVVLGAYSMLDVPLDQYALDY